MADSKDIKVSVIIAIYNTEKFLRQCLESIANQTLKDIEIICVNDGSTDSSLLIAEEFAKSDKRFRVFTKENGEMCAASARNYGIERAQGKYISILDSDDFFKEDMLEKAFDRAECTGSDLVIFGAYEYDEKSKVVYKAHHILKEELVPSKEIFSYKDCPDKIYQLTPGMSWNKLYKREFVEKRNLRFRKIRCADDVYFTYAHMVLAEKIVVLKECLCYYRVNSGVSQMDGITGYPDSSYKAHLELKKSLMEWGIYDEVKQSFVNCAVTFLRFYYDKVKKFEVFEYLHDKYKNEIFNEYEVVNAPKEYFYDERVYMWLRQVIENSAGELAFKAARAYGSANTTSIMRFAFPYKSIPRNSKIVILGTGYEGRHYYSQAILSEYCDVVLWVEKGESFNSNYFNSYAALKEVEFDYALVAYAQKGLIEGAVSFLKEIGVEDEKIVLGDMMQ